MAVALRGTPTTATRSTSGTLAINVPTGVVSGDVIFFFVSQGNASATIATPSGLTLIETKNDGVSGPTVGSYYRVCDGTEPGSYSFSFASAGGNGQCRAYSGADNASPINQHSLFNKTTGGPNCQATTITPSVSGCKLVFFSGTGTASLTFTNPTGFGSQSLTGAASAGSGVGCDQTQGNAAATGTITGTWSATANAWSTVIALKPAALTQTHTAGLGFSGATNKQTSRSLVGVLSFVGSLTRTVARVLVGSLDFSGATTRGIARSHSAVLSFSGSVPRSVARLVSGTLGFSGAIARSVSRPHGGSLSFSGAVASSSRAKAMLLTASLAFTGAIKSRALARTYAASLSFTGRHTRAISRPIVSALSFVGSLASQAAHAPLRLLSPDSGDTISVSPEGVDSISVSPDTPDSLTIPPFS